MINFLIQQFHYFCRKIKKSDIGTRMARGVFWTLLGTVIGKFFVLIAGIIVANILGKDQYGELGLVRSTISMFVIFGVAGLGMTATKYISEFKDINKERLVSIFIIVVVFTLILGLIVSSLVFYCAPYLAEKTLNNPLIVNDIQVGSFFLFFTIINSVLHGVLSGFEDFRSTALTTFVGSFVEFIFMIIGAYYLGVIGALIGYGLGYMVMTLLYVFFIKQNFDRHSISIKFEYLRKKDISIIYRFSLPAALSSFMVAPIFWIVKTMLANVPDGYGELGIYEAADQWRVIILFIPSSLSAILMPILSNSLSKGETISFWRTLKYNIYLNAFFSFVLALLVSFFAKCIMNMYGEDFNDIWTIILVAFSTVFTSISSVVGISIASKGKMWIGFIFNLLWAFIFISFTYYFLMCNMKAIGLALALLLSYFFHSIFQLIYLRFENLK